MLLRKGPRLIPGHRAGHHLDGDQYNLGECNTRAPFTSLNEPQLSILYKGSHGDSMDKGGSSDDAGTQKLLVSSRTTLLPLPILMFSRKHHFFKSLHNNRRYPGYIRSDRNHLAILGTVFISASKT